MKYERFEIPPPPPEYVGQFNSTRYELTEVDDNEFIGRLEVDFMKEFGQGFGYSSALSYPELRKLEITAGTISAATGIREDFVENAITTGNVDESLAQSQSAILHSVMREMATGIVSMAYEQDTFIRGKIARLNETNQISAQTIAKYANIPGAALDAYIKGDSSSISDSEKCSLAIAVTQLDVVLNFSLNLTDAKT